MTGRIRLSRNGDYESHEEDLERLLWKIGESTSQPLLDIGKGCVELAQAAWGC